MSLAMNLLALAALAHAQATISVSARPLSDLLVDSERRAPAKVLSANRAAITSEVSAIVKTVHRDVGADVSKGELLIELDSANARNALAQAEANLAAIEAQIMEAKSQLAKEGFDPAFGARPLRRTLQRRVENPLSTKILQGEFKEGDHIIVDSGPEGFTFSTKTKKKSGK